MSRGIHQELKPSTYSESGFWIFVESLLKLLIIGIVPFIFFFVYFVYGATTALVTIGGVVGVLLLFGGGVLVRAFTFTTPNFTIAILYNSITGGSTVLNQGTSGKWPWEYLENKDKDLIGLSLLSTDDGKPVKATVYSNDGIRMEVSWSFLYRPNPEMILIYRNVDEDDSKIRSGLIGTINQLLSDITSKMSAKEIRQGVSKIKEGIEGALKDNKVLGIMENGEKGEIAISRSLKNRFGIQDFQENIEDADYPDEVGKDFDSRFRSSLISESAQLIREGDGEKIKALEMFKARARKKMRDNPGMSLTDAEDDVLLEYRHELKDVGAKEALNAAQISFGLTKKNITENETRGEAAEQFVGILKSLFSGNK